MNTPKYLIVLFPILLNSCILDCGDNGKLRKGTEELQTRQNRWESLQISSYTLIYNSFANNTTYSQVSVIDGEITAVEIYSADGEFLNSISQSEFSSYYRVTDFFSLIENLDTYVDSLEITYDKTLGYPTTISVDPASEHCDCYGSCTDTIDDEYGYSIQLSTESI